MGESRWFQVCLGVFVVVDSGWSWWWFYVVLMVDLVCSRWLVVVLGCSGWFCVMQGCSGVSSRYF